MAQQQEQQKQQHVFDSSSTSEGSRFCAARLDSEGRLVIQTHDLGGTVEGFFGKGNTEYEAFETFTVEQTQKIREVLGTEDVIAGISRFDSSFALKAHLRDHGIDGGKFWSRIGD
jgi:hypothetical protein